MNLTIGTRGSDLALWQANYVKQQLEKLDCTVQIQIIKTQGDNIQNLAFDKMEGKGFFTAELESALQQGTIDIAVHSYKDLPTQQPNNLCIAAVTERENAADWLIIKPEAVDDTQQFFLKKQATVATSSPRRKSQICSFRPDIQTVDIRGNVPTRINKLQQPNIDALILAAAGLLRLNINLSNYKVVELSPQYLIAAPAQGALAIQINQNNTQLFTLLQQINHLPTEQAINIERQILANLGGGCQQPIGVHCKTLPTNEYAIWASKSESAKAFSRRVYVKNSSSKLAIEQVLQALENKLPKNVFISKDLDENSYFKQAMQQKNYTLTAKSLIEFTPIKYGLVPDVQWIFFSSKHAVQYFFEQAPYLFEYIQFAAIGEGTANALKQKGLPIGFEGKGNDLTIIAKQFQEIANNTAVLFPQAQNSLQTIQKQLPNSIQTINLVVYNNKPLPQIQLPNNLDILVFTSPQNVEAFCNKYTIKPTQKLIAIGTTTANALQQAGHTNITIAQQPTEIALADVC